MDHQFRSQLIDSRLPTTNAACDSPVCAQQLRVRPKASRGTRVKKVTICRNLWNMCVCSASRSLPIAQSHIQIKNLFELFEFWKRERESKLSEPLQVSFVKQNYHFEIVFNFELFTTAVGWWSILAALAVSSCSTETAWFELFLFQRVIGSASRIPRERPVVAHLQRDANSIVPPVCSPRRYHSPLTAAHFGILLYAALLLGCHPLSPVSDSPRLRNQIKTFLFRFHSRLFNTSLKF